MKIALIGDIHFGVKSDARWMLEHQMSFFEKQFFPYLEKNNISIVINPGDLFDRRKYTNHETLYNVRERFLKYIQKKGIMFYESLGNHDVYSKNTNRINAIDLFTNEFDNVVKIYSPTEICIDNFKALIVPWICEDNETEVLKAIKETKCDYLIGHFDIIGAPMYKGVLNDHAGYDRKIFKKFKEVWSGHYHTKSFENNIRYLGTPFEMTWSDESDTKGFYVFDTETLEIQFIKNELNLHEKIFYNDHTIEGKYFLNNLDYNSLKEKIVKIVVEKKTNPKMFEDFLENVYKQNLIECTVLEDMSEFYEQNVQIENVETISTGDLINAFIDDVETDVDKTKLKTITGRIFIEATLGVEEND